MIHNKDQKLKDKYIERIVVKVCAKKYKRGEGSERYDNLAQQWSLIQYHRSLKMRENTMEDVIESIQSSGNDKK